MAVLVFCQTYKPIENSLRFTVTSCILVFCKQQIYAVFNDRFVKTLEHSYIQAISAVIVMISIVTPSGIGKYMSAQNK